MNRKKILAISLVLLLVVVTVFAAAKLFSGEKSAEQLAVEQAGLTYGPLGHDEAKELFNSARDALSGETDLSEEGLKVLEGVAQGCTSSDETLGGRWLITGRVLSPGLEFNSAEISLAQALPQFTVESSEDIVKAQAPDGSFVQVEQLEPGVLFITSGSSCRR